MVIDENWPVVLLGLRISVAVLLYLFLLTGFRALRNELRLRQVVASAPATARLDAPATTVEASPRRAVAHLRVVGGPDVNGLAGRAFPVTTETEIGRSTLNDVVLPDRRVSGRHARLVRRDGAWWIEDLGSTNGTFVNDHPVGDLMRLPRQAELRFGPVVARLERAR